MIKRVLLTASLLAACHGAEAFNRTVDLVPLGTFGPAGGFDEGAAEIVAYDADTHQLFVINSDASTVDILDISDPTAPVLSGVIDVALNVSDSGGLNSVAVSDGLVAVAVENDDTQAPGWVAFYDTDLNFLNAVMAGPLPDMVTFTPNGRYVLVANEGEPSDDYTNDPEGSITVIDLRNGVMNPDVETADFTAFNSGAPAGVRITGPGATVAQDLEPEFIATSSNSRLAWVTLQENNALAIVDIRRARVIDLVGLGSKDHSRWRNALDASNRDDAINITPWPVNGLYQPDSIASFRSLGRTFLITANEGDAREYFFDVDPADIPPGKTEEEACLEDLGGLDFDEDDGCLSWIDEARAKDLELDPSAFPNASELQRDENLGRLNIVATEGDTDGDGDYDQLFSYGARSISIWNAFGRQVYDSGSIMERRTAAAFPDDFNSTNDENGSFDNRSDDKGPEPEGVVTGKLKGRTFAFVGLERIGGIMIFDVTFPRFTRFVNYVNNRDFTVDVEEDLVAAGDLGPEGLVFISRKDSPTRQPLLVVGNEVSGTTTIYGIEVGRR